MVETTEQQPQANLVMFACGCMIAYIILLLFFFWMTANVVTAPPPKTRIAEITIIIHSGKPEAGSEPEGRFSPYTSFSPVEIVLSLISVGNASSAGH